RVCEFCPHCRDLAFSVQSPSTAESYTLSLHDALPILLTVLSCETKEATQFTETALNDTFTDLSGNTVVFKDILERNKGKTMVLEDRKSTRLNSSHVKISYAVFCLKKNSDQLQHRHARR